MNERDTTRDEIARRIAEHVGQPWDDPETDQAAAREVADAVMPVVDRYRAALERVSSWADSMETDLMGQPSLAGRAIAQAARDAIRGDGS